MELTSAMVWAVASVAAIALTILVASDRRGLNVMSRALMALSRAVFAAFTFCKAVFAAVSCALRAGIFNAGFEGL